MLYVCNQGEATVSVIDMQSQAVVETVDLKQMGFSENAKPHHAVAEPDGSHWYVTLIGANTVLKFNRNNEIVGRTDGFEVPGLMSMHPSRDLLLVGRSMSAVNPPKRIGMIQRSDMSVRQFDTFFARPHALSIASDGRHAYTASLATNQLLSVDLESEETNLTRFGGATQTLVQFAESPDGTMMLAGGQVTGQLLLFDTSDPSSIQVLDTLQVGKQPWHPVITPDNKRAYVPNKSSNSISVIDLEAREVTATITGEGIAQPHGTALSPDGRYLFVSNNNRKGTYTPSGDNPDAGTITVIDTQTNDIVKVIEVGTYPTGVGTWGGQRAMGPGAQSASTD
jgi:YVTN family beta-propeller protein